MEELGKNIFYKKDIHQCISHILRNGNFKKILVITGKDSFKRSKQKDVLLNSLAGTEQTYVNDFENNPRFIDIKRIAGLLEDKKFDLVIGIGGGSVLDFAKCLNIFISNHYKNFKDFVHLSNSNECKLLPMLAIPTTAGTGSEATHFAVMYYRNQKFSVSNKNLKPKYVILEPSFTLGISKYLTASTFFDALCQSIESYWSVGATQASKKYAKKSIMYLMSFNPNFKSQNELEEREKLTLGAYFSGKAINISKTTAPHALSYALASHFNIAHGHSVAIVLGHIFLLNETESIELSSPRIINFARHKKNMSNIRRMLSINKNDDFLSFWGNLMKAFQLRAGLGSKLSRNEINALVSNVNVERLSNHPILISKKEISKIYMKI